MSDVSVPPIDRHDDPTPDRLTVPPTGSSDVDSAALRINGERLTRRLSELGEVGGLEGGGCARLALTDADRDGRDLVITWMTELGLDLITDTVGNVTATLAGRENLAPVMMGSHIDTVQTGGIYDGNLGVLAGLEVIETVMRSGFVPRRPMAVAFFTDEEGARFAPDMLGSLVYVGAMSAEEAHDIVSIDGARLGDELERIGYLGSSPCPGLVPHAFIELHIEQGPVLEREGRDIGVVTGVQGISWQRLVITGQSAHAGTTPMELRHDPAYVASEIAVFVRRLAEELGSPQVGTVGTFDLHPNLINVVPASVTMTVDLRNTNEETLKQAEARLVKFCDEVMESEGVTIEATSLARFEPVDFHPEVIDRVEDEAKGQGLSTRRMPSGAGHDAQMLARVSRAGMIFVPSVEGISHNINEFTKASDNENGANVLLQVVLDLAEEKP